MTTTRTPTKTARQPTETARQPATSQSDAGVSEAISLELNAKNGVKRTTGNCPLANALRKLYGGDLLSPNIAKGQISFSLRSTGLRYTYKAPKKVVDWINKLDRDESPRPTKIALPIDSLITIAPRTRQDPTAAIKAGARQYVVENGVTKLRPKQATERSPRSIRTSM